MAKPPTFDDDYELPPLSDEAVVQLHDFLEQFIALFESRYFAQLHRAHNERCGPPPLPASLRTPPVYDDPPF